MTNSILKNKLLVWILLVIFAVTSVMSTTSAFAQTTGDQDSPAEQSEYLDVYYDSEAISMLVFNAIEQREDSLVLKIMTEGFELDGGYADDFYFWAAELTQFEGTGGDYIDTQVKSMSYELEASLPADGIYVNTLTYHFEYYTTVEQETVVGETIEEVLSAITHEDMGYVEVIDSVYTYVCENVSCEAADTDADGLEKTAYGALIENSATSEGIAALIYRMLNEAGIDCRMVEGTVDKGNGPEQYTWNLARLEDGSWYYLDAASDCGAEEFSYFMKGSDFMSENYVPAESEYFVEDYEVATDDWAPYGADMADIVSLDVRFNASGNEEYDFFYLDEGETVFEFELPYYCDLEKGIVIAGFNDNGDPVTEEISLTDVNDGKIMAEVTAVSPDGSSEITYELSFTVEKAPANMEYIMYSFFMVSEDEEEPSGEAGDIIFVKKDNTADLKLPYNTDLSKPVTLSGYYPDGTYFTEKVDMSQSDVKEVVLENGGKKYTVKITVMPPSSDTGCNFDVSIAGYYDEYYTDEDADEDGYLYLTVPYGSFSHEDAVLTIYGYPYDGATIEGEDMLSEEIPFEIGTDEVVVEYTVTAENGDEKVWTLVITEEDGSEASLDYFALEVPDEEEYHGILIEDVEEALIESDSDEGMVIAVPGYYVEDRENEIGLTYYAEAVPSGTITGTYDIWETFYLKDGKATIDIKVSPANPEYADDVKTYRFNLVKESGNSAELEYMDIQWYTESFDYEDIKAGNYSRGVVSVDLEAARTPEGATVKVPAGYFELAEESAVMSELVLNMGAEQYSFMDSEDLDVENMSFKDHFEYLYIDYDEESWTYSFTVTSADRSKTQEYKFTIVKNTEKCPSHAWSDWEIAEESTQSEPGTKFRLCELCGESEWMIVPATDLFGEDSVVRVAGDNRYATSAEISKAFIKDGKAEAIVLVNGKDFPDALAAVPFAASEGGAILMVDGKKGVVSDAVKAEINRIDGDHNANVYIIGGPNAVNTKVDAAMKSIGYTKVERIYGDSRYDTAIELAKKAKGKTAYIANGDNYPDALGIGSAAAVKDGVILFTKTKSLNAKTKAYLQQENFDKVVILGGPNAVSSAVEKELKNVCGAEKVSRAYGAGRCETSVELAKNNFPKTDVVVVATAYNFADALAGGTLAADLEAPIILLDTKKNVLKEDMKAYVKDAGAEHVIVLGGEAAVGKKLYNDLMNLVK